MNINTDYTIRLGNRNIVKIMKGSTTIWEKSTTPVITPDYFYLENAYNGSNTISISSKNKGGTGTWVSSLQYSKDKSTWTTVSLADDNNPVTISMNSGEKVFFRNNNGYFNCITSGYNRITTFNCNQDFNVGGNINTLLNYQDVTNVSLSECCFIDLLTEDIGYSTHLKDASNLILPAMTLANACYRAMFSGCTSLITPPSLPATTLANNCYADMFSNCWSLTSAPALPATTLAKHCYGSMFNECLALKTAPELPATTLAEQCYYGMFSSCSSLNSVTTYANDISASYCLQIWLQNVAATGTFNNNGSAVYTIDSASGIPQGWTEVKPVNADYLYLENVDNKSGNVSFAFKGSTSYDTLKRIEYSKDKLKWTSVNVSSTETTIPTNVGEKVYFRNSNRYCNNQSSFIHFNSDVNVNVGGNLHTLLDYNNVNVPIKSDYVFHYLFSGMKKLLDASQLVLPWTTLRNGCYEDMFGYCSSLTTPPELPATTLVDRCYAFMFENCFSLTSITTYAEDVSANSCIHSWVNNVNTVGTFYNNGNATYTIGFSGIPSGWTEVKPFTGPDYFYMENVDSNSGNVEFRFDGTPSSDTIQQIEWSKDRTNWTTVTLEANRTTTVPVNSGEKVYFRNNNGKCSNGSINNFRFGSYINTNIGGELYTLLDYTNENVSLPTNNVFSGLFKNMNKLIDASGLTLRWTTLVDYCYSSMFYNCTSLTSTPSLPATTLKQYCYSSMFGGCTSLTTAPTLPATTLASRCYETMYQGCTSLTTAPTLPATTLASGCYYGMFQNCTALTTSPELPATTLVLACYMYMFSGCTSLNEVTIYASNISARYCLNNWLSNVASTGTLWNKGTATYPTSSASGIPRGWVELY